MDQQHRQPRFHSKAKLQWQRAMDELLIDAIFGPACRRDAMLVPVPVRASEAQRATRADRPA